MPEITTYAQAATYLEAGRNRTDRPLPGNGTRLIRRGSAIVVNYRGTDVVTYHRDGTYSIDRGGMLSRTTENRIETYSPFRVSAGLLESGWTGKLLRHGPRTWLLTHPNGDGVYLYDGGRYIAA